MEASRKTVAMSGSSSLVEVEVDEEEEEEDKDVDKEGGDLADWLVAATGAGVTFASSAETVDSSEDAESEI